MTSEITIQTKKIELIQWLSTIEDLSLLDKIQDLMRSEKKQDWWLSMSAAERNSIELGIDDADNGRLNSHSKAQGIYGKWL
jgi:hypothetical protein